VKPPSGQHLTFKVSRTDLIDEVKALIEKKLDIRSDDQTLIYAGMPLENGTTLQDYGIQDYPTFHLIVHMRG
jgi:hypothetical protein